MPFDAHKTKAKPPIVIRTATAHELSNYEKYKLKTIEEHAQRNKIENIVLDLNGDIRTASISNKEAVLELGQLAGQNKIYPENISNEDLFIIECSLNTTEEGIS